MRFNVCAMSLVLSLVILLTGQTTPLFSALVQQTLNQPTQNITFKLLAIEATDFNKGPLRDAQTFIKSLQLFTNWQNGTSANFQYFSYIHLLSNVNYEEIDPECRFYYKGNATRNNVIMEITSFLNKTSLENECIASVLVLYYIGQSEKAVDKGKSTLYMALDKPIFDWEINEFLQPNQEKSILMIFDTCYSGGYITKLQKPGVVILAACNPTEETVAGWFTGSTNALYPNGTSFGPLGIIGAIQMVNDFNQDGWLTANEIFQFSWRTLTNFASIQTSPLNLHPWACYGIVGGALPLVQIDQTKQYKGQAKQCTPKSILPNSSRYNWSQMECFTYRYSVTRTGFAQTIGTRTSELLRVTSLNSSVKSSPVVADGILYVATMSGRIYALDLKSGKQLWTFNANISISSTPSIDSGLVIFGTEKPGKIYALDAYTGLVRWQYKIPEGEGVQSSPAITEGKVVIGSEGYLRCFSQFEGDVLWSSYIAGRPSSPAIANNTVYVTSSAYVYAFDFPTGTVKWRYPTSWPIYSSPAVADGLVFVGAENDDQVFALEQETGRKVWSFKTGGWLTSPAIDSCKKLVIAGCRDARTYCINESTGYLKWYHISASNHQSAPTISQDGLVYFGTTNGYFYCLDEDTGREIWKYYVGSSIVSSPIVIYQHVIVASEEGKLFFFGPPFPEHNIAILNASLSPSKIQAGNLLQANFTVSNQGDAIENVAIAVNLNCSSNIIKNFAKINESFVLSPNENLTYTLSLNLTWLPPGFCKLIFEAQTVPDETDASDNAYATDITVIVARVDLDANGEINILDISKAAKAYGSKPGDSNWNPDADINKDNIVNIIDISLIAKEFGKIYPYRF